MRASCDGQNLASRWVGLNSQDLVYCFLTPSDYFLVHYVSIQTGRQKLEFGEKSKDFADFIL